jgi:hypothetical protein
MFSTVDCESCFFSMQVQLTPDLDTPDYQVLYKSPNYEIRSYASYNIAEVVMPPGSGPAAGTGFQELAGYIFGGNKESARMEMTTPVFSTGGGASASRMQFVLDSRPTVEDFPEPNSRGVMRKRESGGLRAALSFSGLPSDSDVRAAIP